MSERAFIGIEIGGTKLQLVVGDASAKVVHRSRHRVDRAAGGNGICRQIESGLTDLIERLGRNPDGIGVGFGGPIDGRTGRVCRSHQIEGWENFALRDWLAGRAGVPVGVDNDANTAAFGEARSGAGIGHDTVFYANFGSGVGGGLVTRGYVYHGSPPGEMEFGHLRIDRSGATVESRCSGWSVDERIRQAVAECDRTGVLARSIGTTVGGEARHLAAALAAGDPIARAVLDDVAGDIGFALSHAVHLAHPDVIVLGGGLSLVGEPFRVAVEAAMNPYIMGAFAPGPPVKLAALGEDAVPVGALHLAMRAAGDARQGSCES